MANKYRLKLMMVEVRNEAGRKVAVEPLFLTMEAETPQQAVGAIGAALGEALRSAFVSLGIQATQAREMAHLAEQLKAAQQPLPLGDDGDLPR